MSTEPPSDAAISDLPDVQSAGAQDASLKAPGKRPARGRAGVFAAILIALILVLQFWIISAGFSGVPWTKIPKISHYYTLLAVGFFHGQLSTSIQPDPRMLLLRDPYDPQENKAYRIHDLILYNNKYYEYWGPVPALLIDAWFTIVGSEDSVGDEYLVYLFCAGTMIFSGMLLVTIKNRLYPEQPRWTIALPILSLGLGTPIMFTLARPAVYEAAIFGGQCFLTGGLAAILIALQCQRKIAMMTLGGIGLTLAVGSRVSLAPTAGVIVASVVLLLWFAAKSPRRRWIDTSPALGLIVPSLIGAALFCTYNHRRFGSITEFGLRYQLAGVNFHALPNSSFLSKQYVLPNALRYFFEIPVFRRFFPFIYARSQSPWLLQTFHLPSMFSFEHCTGLVWSQPFFIFAIAAMWLVLIRPATRRSQTTDRDNRAIKIWLVAMLIPSIFLAFYITLFTLGATMRYLVDSAPLATLLAAIGLWEVLRRANNHTLLRRLMLYGALAIVMLQSVEGFLMGFSGYRDYFASFNPGLLARFQSILKV